MTGVRCSTVITLVPNKDHPRQKTREKDGVLIDRRRWIAFLVSSFFSFLCLSIIFTSSLASFSRALALCSLSFSLSFSHALRRRNLIARKHEKKKQTTGKNKWRKKKRKRREKEDESETRTGRERGESEDVSPQNLDTANFLLFMAKACASKTNHPSQKRRSPALCCYAPGGPCCVLLNLSVALSCT